MIRVNALAVVDAIKDALIAEQLWHTIHKLCSNAD